MSKPPTKQTKQAEKPYFRRLDDEIMITHEGKSKPHRVVFRDSKIFGVLPTDSSIYTKLKNCILDFKENTPMNFLKNESFTFGLSKLGKIVLYVKSNLSVFPKEFVRFLRQISMTDNEIKDLIFHLDFVELEISHKINDPLGYLKKARVHYDFNSLIERLIAFTDESYGNIELELKGDPETSGNLEYLLRDKLNAVLYFAELTKILVKFIKLLEEVNNSQMFIKNALTFLIDDLLNNRLVNNELNKKKR